MGLFLVFQESFEIEKKMQVAPDNSYEIGIAIGTYLPFVVLVLIAYVFYYYSKKRKSRE
jgi:uncharacterized membrane protein YukC